MKPRLSKSVIQFREQADDAYPDRDRRSDGTIGDARHAASKSDHNPCPHTGYIRAFDLDAWVKYRGTNPHISHIHISFTKAGDEDRSFFQIPLLGGKS